MRLMVAAGGWVIALSLLGAASFGVFVACDAHERGIYAGYQYADAARVASRALVHQYGFNTVNQLKYKGEVHTHFAGGIGQQVRVFHFLGPGGARYCVSVWKTGHNDSDFSHWQISTTRKGKPAKGVGVGCSFK